MHVLCVFAARADLFSFFRCSAFGFRLSFSSAEVEALSRLVELTRYTSSLILISCYPPFTPYARPTFALLPLIGNLTGMQRLHRNDKPREKNAKT